MKNLKQLLFLSILILLITPMTAQIEWSQTIGGSSIDSAWKLIESDDGNYVVVGGHRSSDGDFTSNQGGSDCLVFSLDSNGDLIWLTSFGGTLRDDLRDIIQTADGGFLVAGHTYSNDGDFGASNGDSEVMVAKLDAEGTIVWNKLYGGLEKDDSFALSLTNDGGFILACGSYSTDGDASENKGDRDAWIIKATEEGEIEWEKSYGGSAYDLALTISPKEDGGYVFGGTTESSDGDISAHKGNSDIWVWETDAQGNIIWEKTYGGSSNDRIYNMLPLDNGGFILIGSTDSFDGDVENPNYGLDDVFILEIDETGTIVWTNTFGGSGIDFCADVQPNVNGGYWAVGYTDSMDGDLMNPTPGTDWWIFEIGEEGKIGSGKTFGGTERERVFSSVIAADNSLICVGSTNSNDGDFSATSGSTDILVAKITNDISQLKEFIFNSSISLYPNPASDQIQIEIEANVSNAEYSIYNSMGQKLTSGILENQVKVLDVHDLVQGKYVLTVQGGDQIYRKKFVKL